VAVFPSFTLSGVLPPYDPNHGPTADTPFGRSPYAISPELLVAIFATSEERKFLLLQLFNYRARLRELGFVTGHQWIDGSFVEDVETLRGRPPGDIDFVTFTRRPSAVTDDSAWTAFVVENAAIINAEGQNGLHAFFVDLSLPPEVIVRRSAYWFGLFSHQRETALWKGLVQLDLETDDGAAIALLEGDTHAQ